MSEDYHKMRCASKYFIIHVYIFGYHQLEWSTRPKHADQRELLNTDVPAEVFEVVPNGKKEFDIRSH